MKKDSIQTRNRKLATKATKRKSIMHDFFKPFDSRFSAMYSSMGSSYLAAAAAGNPMSQYYGQMGAVSAMQPFMSSAAMASHNFSHLNQPTASDGLNLGQPSTGHPDGSLYNHTSAASYANAVGGGDDSAAVPPSSNSENGGGNPNSMIGATA
jgi:hypothetical protein